MLRHRHHHYCTIPLLRRLPSVSNSQSWCSLRIQSTNTTSPPTPASFDEFFKYNMKHVADAALLPEDQKQNIINTNVNDFVVSRDLCAEHKKLNGALYDLFFKTITNIVKNTSPLQPGRVPRNTDVQPYGMRARGTELAFLSLSVKNSFFSTENKKNNNGKNNDHQHGITNNNNNNNIYDEKKVFAPPIFLIISINRQGKTLFLDTVANDSRFHAKITSWSGGKLSLVFNITFNSKFYIFGSAGSTFTLKNAVVELLLRLVCAVEGIHASGNQVISPLRALLESFQRNDDEMLRVSPFVIRLQEAVAQGYGRDRKEIVFFILMDEVTELTRRLGTTSSAADAKTDFQEMFSSILELVSADECACVLAVTGFSHYVAKDFLTGSPRSRRYVPLIPINKATLRRNALVLTTQYFSTVGRLFRDRPERLAEALFHYELMKSSLGILGNVNNELLQAAIDDNPITVSISIGRIPIVQMIKSNPDLHQLMVEVLQWKSIQFLKEFLPEPSAQRSMEDVCRLAQREKVAHLPSSGIRWFHESDRLRAASRMLHQLSDEELNTLEGPLSSVLVEPLFLAIELKRSRGRSRCEMTLVRYTKMLDNFCLALCDDTVRDGALRPSCDLALVSSHFKTRVSPPYAALFRLDKLPGSFFESAIAQGIIIQKSLRADLVERLQESEGPDYEMPSLISDLRDFLFDAEHIFSNKGVPTIDWSYEGDAAPRVLNFSGHFPLNDDPAPVVVSHPSDRKQKFSSSIESHFNTSTVLCTYPKDNNPLTDIIFNEAEEANESAAPRLVQFWIDAKHRHSRRDVLNNFNTFPKHVSSALRNPLLQNSIVKHIVHIVVTPSKFSGSALASLKTELEKNLQNNSSASPLYSLYLVSPDSIAFENLVSHYVARTVPLMEQQLRDAWSQRLGSPDQWKGYKATARSGLDHWLGHPSSLPSAFQEWRAMRTSDESVMSVWALFDDAEELVRQQHHQEATDGNVEERVQIEIQKAIDAESAKALKIDADQINAMRFLPFGAVFEELGVTRPADPNDPKLSFKKRPAHRPLIDAAISLIKSNADVQMRFLDRHMCAGMLVDRFESDEAVDGVWNLFFDKAFVLAWQQKAAACVAEGVVDVEWRSHENEPAFYGAASVAATIWDMSAGAWIQNRQQYNNNRVPEKFNRPRELVGKGLRLAPRFSQCYFLLRQLDSDGLDQHARGAARAIVQTIDANVDSFVGEIGNK